MISSTFVYGLIGNLVIAAAIIALVFVVNLIRKKTMKNMENLIACTVGLLLAIIFLGFLPEIIESQSVAPAMIGWLIIIGIFGFYILELFLHWHHCKDIDGAECHDHAHENSPLMFTGTFVHNFLHGIVLFSAFSASTAVGVATTFAVLLHAIPQNIANLLMNHKDVRYAYVAAFGGVIGALFTYPIQTLLLEYTFHILSVIAGALLYTAMSDILPSFKEKGELQHKAIYLLWMIGGVVLFVVLNTIAHEVEHHYGEEIESHEENELREIESFE